MQLSLSLISTLFPTRRSSDLGLPRHSFIIRCADNLVNQRLMLSMLKRLGYSADWANNGREAVERAHASYYPMIFMGEELALRSEEHTSELQSQSNLVCRLLLE